MKIRGAASSALRDLLDGPPRPAVLLGAGRYASYFRVPSPAGERVVAVVAADAVRLPCAVVVNVAVPAPTGACEVGGGGLRWDGADGPIAITASRYWRPARVRPAGVSADELRRALGRADAGVDGDLVGALGPDAVGAVGELLGRGPGLTPAGDDVLAGFLLGARAFGVAVEPVRAVVAARAVHRTSALSAQLLRHALAGECVAQVLPALARAEVGPLLRVGHTSGPALGRGLLRAAEVRADLAAAA